MVYSINGRAVQQSEIRDILRQVSEETSLRPFHNGNHNFTESELGRILNAETSTGLLINGRDREAIRGLNPQQFTRLSQEFQTRFPHSRYRVSSSLFSPSAITSTIHSQPSTSMDTWLDTDLFRTQILPTRTDINYSRILQGARAVFFGDQHDTTHAEETELAAHMRDFRTLGITHLGMEMVPSDLQADLDQYFQNGGEIPSSVYRHIEQRNRDPQIIQGYLDLIRSAQAAGVRIVAIEHPQVSHGLGMDHTFGMETRNPHWTNIIHRTLTQNPQNRIIVFGGASHFGFPQQNFAYSTVNQQLVTAGIPASEMKVVGMTNYFLEESLRNSPLVNQRFMIETHLNTPNPGADFLIHPNGR